MIVGRQELAPARAAGAANEYGGDQDREPRTWPSRRQPRAARLSQRPLPEPPPAPLARCPEGAPLEIAVLDSGGRIVGVNDAWRDACAGQAWAGQDGGVGALYVDALARYAPDLDHGALEQGLSRLLSGAAGDVRLTCTAQTASGPGRRHLQIAPLTVGEAGRFAAIHSDQIELATAREALKTTSEQLLSAKDDERRHIAMELHDSTCQHLAALGFGLARLRRALPGAGEAILDEMAQSLAEAVKETRVLSYLMKPRGLDPQGLSMTVLKFLEGFARRTGLEVSLEAGPAVDHVALPLQHAALRIVQEALLNANRHAHAKRVAVGLSVDGGMLTVTITDDGRGMGTAHAAPCLGVGIPGMRARAQQFLGDLAISSDARGTRVVALLPLS